MQYSAGFNMLLPLLYILGILTVPILSEILPITTEFIETSTEELTTIWPESESDNDVNFSYDGTEYNEVYHEAPSTDLADQALDVNGTIEEVLNIIAANPNLPRLSRSEILEILDNLTMSQDVNVKEELLRIKSYDEDYQSIPSKYKSREEYAKALMLVLPFNAKNMSESKIQELYTKAPVTQLVGNTSEYDRIILAQNDHTSYQPHESTKPVYKQTDHTYNISQHQTVPKPSRHPVQKQPQKSSETFGSKIPKPSPNSNEEYTENQHFQHEVKKHTQPSVILKTTLQPPTTFVKYNPQTQKENIQLELPSDMKDLVSFAVQTPTTTAAPERITLFMTPSSDELAMETLPLVTENIRYNSQYPLQNSENITRDPYRTTEKSSVNTNVKEVLASIGLYPDLMKTDASQRHPVIQTTPKIIPLSDISLAAESLTPDMKQLLVSFGLLPSETQEHTEATLSKTAGLPYHNIGASPTIDPSSYLGFKPLPIATENKGSKQGNNMLSSDMNEFLASFSLVPMPDTASQKNFRSQKSMDTTTIKTVIKEKPEKNTSNLSDLPNVNTEMMTDEMREVLETLGLVPSSKSKKNPSFMEDEPGHIFNPAEHSASLNHTAEDAKRLNTLLEAIKQFVKDNTTFTPEEVQALHNSFSLSHPSEASQNKESTTITSTAVPKFIPKKNSTRLMSLDQIENAPDPLALEELVQLYNTNKNEVKRQQLNDTFDSITTETSDTITTTETTEERNPSFDALADSFGGGETASSDVNVEEQLPATRPNGLYFLLDWNSFLEVGEEGKNKVNLRIAPKIGDSRNFLPVNVP